MKKYEELAHREPVNSHRWKKTSYCLHHHPVLKETSSTTRTRIVFNAGAKFSNGPQQQHNYSVLPMVNSSTVLTWIQGPSNKWKTFVGNRVATIQEQTTTATWRHVPSQSNPVDLISRGTDPATLSSSTLWWKGPQGLQQEPSNWSTTEFNTPTDNLEIRNVHVALIHAEEDITQRFSKLNRLIRVIAYCRRFINNCRQPKANRQTTTLSTQDLDKGLTCCVKMAQQTAYAQEVEELAQHQEISRNSSLKTLHPFIDQEDILRVGG
jgi:hypothetical protein